MKKVYLSLLFSVFLLISFAQKGLPKEERISPPAKISAVAGKSIVTIDYSQPSIKGRKVWDGIVPFDSVWRTGANEATTFETQKDIKIEGNILPAGKYALFTIPGNSEWIIIFNKEPNQWGAFKYDKNVDQLRIKVKPIKTSQFQEQFTFFIENNRRIFFKWENLEVGFNVSK